MPGLMSSVGKNLHECWEKVTDMTLPTHGSISSLITADLGESASQTLCPSSGHMVCSMWSVLACASLLIGVNAISLLHHYHP